MKKTKPFIIGQVVTLKSHPLFRETKKILEFPSQVPPLMLIKEVLFERKETKKIYSDEVEKAQVSDLIKYICVYFNGNKSEFVEKTIYHSMLRSYEDLKYYREFEEKNKKKIALDKQLIPEVVKYKSVSKYEYGKVVQFKTKKLEQRKSYESGFERIPGTTFQTPDFVLSGIKNLEQKELFYQDGEPRNIKSKYLFKVLWFNHVQQKFSEYYLPNEFFVQDLKLQ